MDTTTGSLRIGSSTFASPVVDYLADITFTASSRTGYSPFDVTFTANITVSSQDRAILNSHNLKEIRWWFDHSRHPNSYEIQTINNTSPTSAMTYSYLKEDLKGYKGKTLDVACVAVFEKK